MSDAKKHTPGKLATDDGDSRVYGLFAEDNDAIAYLSENACKGTGLRGPFQDRANADRLVLCWNTHDDMRAEIERLRAVRAELLAALEGVREALVVESVVGNRPPADCEHVLAVADAAIEKARAV